MINEKTIVPIVMGVVTTVAICAIAFKKAKARGPNGWSFTGKKS